MTRKWCLHFNPRDQLSMDNLRLAVVFASREVGLAAGEVIDPEQVHFLEDLECQRGRLFLMAMDVH